MFDDGKAIGPPDGPAVGEAVGPSVGPALAQVAIPSNPPQWLVRLLTLEKTEQSEYSALTKELRLTASGALAAGTNEKNRC